MVAADDDGEHRGRLLAGEVLVEAPELLLLVRDGHAL